MTEDKKAQIYGSLLNEHTKLFNEINLIKAQNIDLNSEQLRKIQQMEYRQLQIMEQIRRLMS
jgi:hypothetical protein